MKLTKLRQVRKSGHRLPGLWLWLCPVACLCMFVLQATPMTASTASASIWSNGELSRHVRNLGHGVNAGMLQAIFWTRASDGTMQFETRRIADDSVTGFAQEYPTWHLDAELSWFFRTPVYEREVPAKVATDDKDAV